MMDYESAAAQQMPNKTPTALDCVSYLADDLNGSANRIETFLARFHGNATAERANGNISAVPAGHAGQIERLRDVAGRLEKLTSELGNIG
jgi:hypothetical protein